MGAASSSVVGVLASGRRRPVTSPVFGRIRRFRSTSTCRPTRISSAQARGTSCARRLSARSAQTLGSPPRLTVEDTVLDLATTGSDGDVVTLVADALRLRLTTPSRLRAALGRRARHPRRRLLTELLTDADGIESGLELAYLRDVERAHDLPRAIRQGGLPDLPYRTDVDYDEFGLLVELDGRRGHEVPADSGT